MLTCPKCGSANTEGSTFCISCGTDLHPSQAQAPPPPGTAPPPPPSWSSPPPPPSAAPPPPSAPYGQPQYGQPQYAPPPVGYAPPPPGYYYGAPAQTTNGLAVVSLILGISGFVGLCGIGPLGALITGYIAKGNIDKSGGREGGRGLALAGIILGWIGIVLAVGLIVLIIVAAAVGDNTTT